MYSIETEDVKIVYITKLGGFYDSDNHVLIEVTDPKLMEACVGQR